MLNWPYTLVSLKLVIFKVIVILISLGLAGVMSWSLSNIKKGMDLEAALPTSSFIRQYIEINNQYFPGEGTPFAVYCGMLLHFFLFHHSLICLNSVNPKGRSQNFSIVTHTKVGQPQKQATVYIN